MQKRTPFTHPIASNTNRKSSFPLGWRRFLLLYICVLCVVNTAFVAPAGYGKQKGPCPQEEQTLLEIVLEKCGEACETPNDEPEEMDDIVKKLEFVVSPFALPAPSYVIQSKTEQFQTFFLTPPFTSLVTPPPKA
jgi:hypothetical protein